MLCFALKVITSRLVCAQNQETDSSTTATVATITTITVLKVRSMTLTLVIQIGTRTAQTQTGVLSHLFSINPRDLQLKVTSNLSDKSLLNLLVLYICIF